MGGAVTSVSEPPVTFSTREGSLPGVGSKVRLVDVFMSKVTAAVAALVNVVTGVEVHVHPDVVSAGVHLVTHQADVAVAGVAQSVDHELILHLAGCRLSGKVEGRRFPLLSG